MLEGFVVEFFVSATVQVTIDGCFVVVVVGGGGGVVGRIVVSGPNGFTIASISLVAKLPLTDSKIDDTLSLFVSASRISLDAVVDDDDDTGGGGVIVTVVDSTFTARIDAAVTLIKSLMVVTLGGAFTVVVVT